MVSGRKEWMGNSAESARNCPSTPLDPMTNFAVKGRIKDPVQQDFPAFHCAYYEKRGRGGSYLPYTQLAGRVRHTVSLL